MSYTPGPWTYQVHNLPNLVLTIRTEIQKYYIAEVGRVDVATENEYMDNAKLIAAAPELLDACKEMCDWLGFTFGSQFAGEPAHRLAMQAIKKAEEEIT